MVIHCITWLMCLIDQGEYEKALEYYEESLKLKKKSLGDEHVKVGDTLYNMAGVFEGIQRYKDAYEYFTKAHVIYSKVYGAGHAESLDAKERIEEIASFL